MNFNPRKRRFLKPNGEELTPAEVRKEVENFITEEKKDVDREANRLLAGLITLPVFFELMREKIQSWHSIAGVIAYGGQSQMNDERWGRINEKIQSELSYLADFEKAAEESFQAAQQIAAKVAESIADKIPDGLDTVVEEQVAEALATAATSEAEDVARQAAIDALSDSMDEEEIEEALSGMSVGSMAGALIGGAIASRAAQYASSMYSTFENSRRAHARDSGLVLGQRDCVDDSASCESCPGLATNGPVPIDEITEVGSDCECGANCRCEISFFGAEAIDDADLGDHDAIFTEEHREERFGPDGTLNRGPANAEGRRGART